MSGGPPKKYLVCSACRTKSCADAVLFCEDYRDADLVWADVPFPADSPRVVGANPNPDPDHGGPHT